MISAAELAVQRKLTKAFIAADQLSVTLMRAAWEDDGAGGVVKGVLTARPVQVMRLIPQSDSGLPRTTADGQQVQPSYRLLGTHEADMERWDQFVLDGERYEVVFVNENRQYEVKGEVVYLG